MNQKNLWKQETKEQGGCRRRREGEDLTQHMDAIEKKEEIAEMIKEREKSRKTRNVG